MIHAPPAYRSEIFMGIDGNGHYQSVMKALAGMSTVEVYKNLHKNCWSVRHKGKVVLHTNAICLTSASFVVRERGRQRVLSEKRKNVHAFVRGAPANPKWATEFASTYEPPLGWKGVTYNPYENETFVDFNGESVLTASYANLLINPDRTEVFALL
jgi:hypothetical protein